MSEAHAIEAELIESAAAPEPAREPAPAPGGDLTAAAPAGADDLTIFASRRGLEAQVALADSLVHFVRERELSVKIGSGEHLRVEAWQWLGSQLGVFGRTVETGEIRDPETLEFVGYKATVEAVHRTSGNVVGRADAICCADESQKRWVDAENGKRRQEWVRRWITDGRPVRHAILSMAQTRATSKALSQALRFVVVMAGYSGTPSEEMAGFESAETPPSPPPRPREDDLPRAGTVKRTPPAGPRADQRPAPEPAFAAKPASTPPAEPAEPKDPAENPIGRPQAITLTGIASRRALEFEGVTGIDILNDIARQKELGTWESMWPRIKMRQIPAVSKAIQGWEPPVRREEGSSDD